MHAIVDLFRGRRARATDGEALQLEPNPKQPVDGVSVEVLSDALSLNGDGQRQPCASVPGRNRGHHARRDRNRCLETQSCLGDSINRMLVFHSATRLSRTLDASPP